MTWRFAIWSIYWIWLALVWAKFYSILVSSVVFCCSLVLAWVVSAIFSSNSICFSFKISVTCSNAALFVFTLFYSAFSEASIFTIGRNFY